MWLELAFYALAVLGGGEFLQDRPSCLGGFAVGLCPGICDWGLSPFAGFTEAGLRPGIIPVLWVWAICLSCEVVYLVDYSPFAGVRVLWPGTALRATGLFPFFRGSDS